MNAVCVARPGHTLRGQVSGEGPPILLLHGLTATRRYVVHGSTALDRAGHRVIALDARGHGESDPAPASRAYTYADYVADAEAILDATDTPHAVVVGQSMGAAAAVALTLASPERVDALVLITPAHLGKPSANLARWDALADGLERGGPAGFLEALGNPSADDRYNETVRTVIAQRLARHAHPAAVANALRATPRSVAFAGIDALAGVTVPTLVIGSRDAADPDHPLAVAEEWTRQIPNSRLLVEGPDESPLAWRGGSLSVAILEFLALVV